MSKNHKAKWCVGVDRSFSDEELDRFLSVVDEPRLRFAFELMARLGLRRSEVVRIRRDDILLDKVKPIIRIHNVKCKRMDTLRLHNMTAALVESYLQEFEDEINNHDGYLVWTNDSTTAKRHLHDGWMAQRFRVYIRKAGLDDTYASVDTSGKQKAPNGKRKLYRLSTHSLRHYYISKYARKGINPYVIQRLARHKDFSSTQTYIHLNEKDEEEAINTTWGNSMTVSDSSAGAKEFAEFMKMYGVWKGVVGK